MRDLLSVIVSAASVGDMKALSIILGG
jgi:hypothetical protein